MSDLEEPSVVFSTFPDQIISDILTRLPAKSICRFKLVSRQWKSIICNPHFITSYISRTPPSWAPLNRLVLVDSPDPTEFRLLDPPCISSLSINPRKLAPNPARSEYPSVVLHSSSGLLLFDLHVSRDPHKEHAMDPTHFSIMDKEVALFVLNPLRAYQWAPLPKPPHPINKRAHVGFTTRVDPDPTGDGEVVVGRFMVVEYQPVIGSGEANLLCYSSDTGEWEEKIANYMLGMHFWRAEASFEFEGRLFWVDLSVGVITWDVDDPFRGLGRKEETAVCRFIPLPTGRAKPYNTPGLERERCIDGGGGFVQYLEVFKEGEFAVKVWRMEDCESGEWSLKYKVSSSCVEGFLAASGVKKGMPKPCFVHPFKADTVFFENGDSIFSLNVRTVEVESCGSFVGYQFVLPHVLPSWPTSLPPRWCAAFAKEEGNEYFKCGKFDEAISCYSRSITLLPNAVAYANRAMGYLKVHKFQEAEVDCTRALNLDDKYFKVYGRRAIARKELGNLEGSLEDLVSALKLDPEQHELLMQYAEIKSLLEKASGTGCENNHGGGPSD